LASISQAGKDRSGAIHQILVALWSLGCIRGALAGVFLWEWHPDQPRSGNDPLNLNQPRLQELLRDFWSGKRLSDTTSGESPEPEILIKSATFSKQQ
jgi:hypothetical protein